MNVHRHMFQMVQRLLAEIGFHGDQKFKQKKPVTGALPRAYRVHVRFRAGCWSYFMQ